MINYPTTYEKCCAVLEMTAEQIEANISLKYKTDAIRTFQRVVICRDAYLKIAELNNIKFDKDRYIIKVQGDSIVKEATSNASYVLSFPTEKIRDTFYSNFEKDIFKIMSIL